MLFLYRVTENDDDGDPLDFGVVQANDMDDACELLKPRFASIGLFGDDGVVEVYLYAGTLPRRGVMDTDGSERETVVIEGSDEEDGL